ncbi:DNA primase large subunit-like isoform X3 [Pogonomyrmex barbatus]|uniref:DNA primase large subunit n=1 Tax=Pogonomyrmex barbatus TaxID=144034 RepID=A0A8N1S5C3_9HYME|nr:DNA primase large subunit-like isoform X3 [Pogonomyrmex barbatus]
MTSTMRFQVPVKISLENPNDVYLHDLQFYQNAPFGTATLDELREISETRLKVLSLVERVHLQKLTMSISQRRAMLVKELQKEKLDEFAKLIDSPGCKSHTDIDIHARRRDHISHFVLRSAVAFNALKKRWFFKQEARLFKWRFSSLDSKGIKQFMSINNLNFTLISESEKEDIREYLQMSSPYNAREARANLYDDERLTQIFAYLENNIHTESTVLVQDLEIQQYVSLDNLDKLAETSYPLCMRVLHKALRKNHHLTHGGRIQYCLFLKGIGLSLSDAIIFWKNEFIKVMDEIRFNKEHSYNIRFIFGLEGSRRDYQPYTCLRIMESIVGPRDYHGCPFKHMLHDILEDELMDCGFDALERSAIMNLSKDGQYSAACNKYYEIKHNCLNDTLFKHPNIYFNNSVKHCTSYHDVDPEIGDT